MSEPALRLHADVQGPNTGETVLLVHGFPVDHTMWREQVAMLVKSGFRTVAVDLPGFGKSPAAGKAPTMADISLAIHQKLKELKVADYHLIGFSMGSYVALQLVLDRFQDVRSLTLVGSKAEGDSPEGKAVRDETIKKVREKGTVVLADAMLPKFLTERTTAARPDLVKSVRDVILATKPEGAIQALETMKGRPDQRPNLGRIHCRTLIVVGAEDKLTPVESARVLQQGISDAQLRIVTGAAHLVPLEAPEPLNHFLEDHLKGALNPLKLGGLGPKR